MSEACIGIDLAAKTCVGAVRNERGELVYLCEFPTGEKGLVALVESVEGEATVLLEGCDLAYRARRVILPHAERLEAADPRRDSRIHGDPIKNDEIDAEKLSEIAFLGSYHPVHHTPDEEVYALHLAVKAYDKLTKKTAVQKNRIKAELQVPGHHRRGVQDLRRKGKGRGALPGGEPRGAGDNSGPTTISWISS